MSAFLKAIVVFISRCLNVLFGGQWRYTLSAQTGLKSLARGKESRWHVFNDGLWMMLLGQHEHAYDAVEEDELADYFIDKKEREYARKVRDGILLDAQALSRKTEFRL